MLVGAGCGGGADGSTAARAPQGPSSAALRAKLDAATKVTASSFAPAGGRMTFIHQEVYKGNMPSKGLRPPLQAFNLPTEPWLFVLDKAGRITARLEGSFGFRAFERAIRTGL